MLFAFVNIAVLLIVARRRASTCFTKNKMSLSDFRRAAVSIKWLIDIWCIVSVCLSRATLRGGGSIALVARGRASARFAKTKMSLSGFGLAAARIN